VDVSVNEPWQHVQAAGLEDFVGGLGRAGRQDCAHATVFDQQVGWPHRELVN